MIYVTSDLHGWPLARFQGLLKQADFGADDFLFVLGDVIDRGEDGVELLTYLMEQPNMQLILGNHEAMLLACSFLFEEVTEESLERLTADRLGALSDWMQNGAEPTLKALRALPRDRMRELLSYLREAPLYDAVSLPGGDWLLVHSGLGHYAPGKRMREYTPDELLWHRPAPEERYRKDLTVVLGHTPTQFYGCPGRAYVTDTWTDIDTGAGQGGSPMLLRLDDRRMFYAQ